MLLVSQWVLLWPPLRSASPWLSPKKGHEELWPLSSSGSHLAIAGRGMEYHIHGGDGAGGTFEKGCNAFPLLLAAGCTALHLHLHLQLLHCTLALSLQCSALLRCALLRYALPCYAVHTLQASGI